MESRKERNKKLVREINHERRVEISKSIFKVVFIIIMIIMFVFLYMHFIGTSFITINENKIITNNDSFYGLKILQFSDLLYGSTINYKDLQDLQKKIKEIKPDLIVFTGNLISDEYPSNENDIQHLINFLRDLKADYGKYAVYGDKDSTEYSEIMHKAGFYLLDNQDINIYNKSNDYIKIIGLNTNNLENLSINDDNYTITLINNYDLYKKFNVTSNLVLAGNNLGGEIKIPFVGGIIRDNSYMKDYYQMDDYEVYISNGLGTNHRLRLFNHPSINVFRVN